MNRITKIREEIGGKQVDLTFYGRFCSLIEGDRKIILRAIKNGRKKGVIGAIQPGRHDRIWTTWSIAFDDLRVGDTVEFSTSGKYNPGFHATEKYVGCVEWIRGSECAIKTGNGIAVVLIKHVERVVKIMDLRMFIDLFQEIEVENLFKALDLCMEYVRLDLHVFNVGAYVTCSYSNDLESLSQAEGCNVNMIIEVPHLFEAFMEYASPEMKLYYEKLTEIV